MARERKVFDDYDECARAWYFRRQEEGRTRGHRMWFRGNTIYSYGNHFPLASMVENSAGRYAFLVNSDKYSNTTAKHKIAVARAMNGTQVPRFNVPTGVIRDFRDTPDFHASQLRYRMVEIMDLYEKSKRARGRKQQYVNEAMDHVGEARSYAEFFKLPAPFMVAKDQATKLAMALVGNDAYLSALVTAAKELGSIVNVLEISARHLAKE